jgi:hypothetical protein
MSSAYFNEEIWKRATQLGGTYRQSFGCFGSNAFCFNNSENAKKFETFLASKGYTCNMNNLPGVVVINGGGFAN